MLPKWTQAAPLASSIASRKSASPSVSVVVATQERIGPGARSLQGIVLEDRLPIEHRQPFSFGSRRSQAVAQMQGLAGTSHSPASEPPHGPSRWFLTHCDSGQT